MAYPRFLKLDPDTKASLVSYLKEELLNNDAERQKKIDELKQHQTDYWAAPSQTQKTFPFKGAANIIIPLTAIAVETIHARTMQTLFAVDPIMNVEARRGDFDDYESPLEEHLQYEFTKNVQVRKPLDSAILELEKFGTGIAKSGYERIVKKGVRPALDGSQRDEEFPVITKDGATLDAVPQANFLMPFYAKDPQTSPWVGEEHSRTPYEVKLLEQAGLFEIGTFKALEMYVGSPEYAALSRSRDYEKHQETLENRVPVWPKRINWVELWMAYDVDGDGIDEEIVVHFCKDCELVMAVRYNWHVDLRRPYEIGVYMTIENRWGGIGICKQNEQFQRSITTRHRQTLDSGTIANMKMFKVNKLSGYGPKEPIFPGKMWFLDDMSYIEPMEMADIKNSSFALEQSDLVYSQMRVGVNEATLGMPQGGTPGTATSDLSKIQESQKKFDFFYGNIKDFTSRVLFDVFCNIHQFGPKNVGYFEWCEHGDLLKKLYAQPLNVIRDGLMFDIQAVGAKKNRLLDRQDWVQIAGVLQQYYAGMLQLGQMSQDPQLIQLILTKGMGAATEAMRQILETFEVRNIERIILYELDNINKQQNGNGASNGTNRLNSLSLGGGDQGPPGNGQGQGMDSLAKVVALFGGLGSQGTAGV